MSNENALEILTGEVKRIDGRISDYKGWRQDAIERAAYTRECLAALEIQRASLMASIDSLHGDECLLSTPEERT